MFPPPCVASAVAHNGDAMSSTCSEMSDSTNYKCLTISFEKRFVSARYDNTQYAFLLIEAYESSPAQ